MSSLSVHSGETAQRRLRIRTSTLIFGALAVGIAIQLAFFVLYRMVNLDEGWYLWAGKLVLQGQLPYRDFAYTQTPLLPYIYGAVGRIWGEGLYQGRILSSLLCVVTAGLTTLIAYRIAEERDDPQTGMRAACGALLLFATGVYATVHLTYTATYALATFWVMLSLLVAVTPTAPTASSTPHRSSRPAWHLSESVRNALAIALICLAIATRMSAVAIAPPLALYLVATSRRRWYALAVIAGTGVLALLLLLGSFWWASDGRMFYHIFGFHTDRITSTQRQLEKAWYTTSDTLLIFGVPLVLGAAGMIRGWVDDRRRGGWRYAVQRRGPEWMLLGMIVLPWLLHLIPRTTASYYNTLQAPLIYVFGGLGLANLWRASATPRRTALLVTTGVLAALNLLVNSGAVLRDGLVRFPPRNQIEIVQTAAEFLRNMETTDGRIITLNAHLALEAGMELPSGYEMSIFAYRPTWSTAQAEQYNAINNEILLRDLRAGADAVAITDFDLERFYGERQQIFETMWRHYRFAKTVPGFDPFWKNLYIYVRPQFSLPPMETPRYVQLADGISLQGYDLAVDGVDAGDGEAALRLGLYWQAEETPSRPYTVFVHLLDADGRLVTNWDNPPCRTVCPTDSWLPGEVVRDDYVIPLPAALPPGTYALQVGMYDSQTGDPLPVQSGGDAGVSERFTLETIQFQ